MNPIKIIADTLETILDGEYTDPVGRVHKVNNLWINTDKYNGWLLSKNPRSPVVDVVNMDSLDAAEWLRTEGYRNVAVLNMASWCNPGGGVLRGSLAQEEDLCRRTNLLYSIGQGSEIVSRCLRLQYDKDLYPLRDHDVIVSKGVTVFRKSGTYEYMTDPFRCDILTCAAIQNPVLVRGRLSESDRKLMKNKIRRILDNCRRSSIVLGAFGCGAYGNPPKEVAEIFKEVIEEGTRTVERIVFAILDKNRTDNNLKPFQDVFNS